MDRGTSIHLYYIAREGVVNAVKHGKCTHVIITLRRENDRFALIVEDNGMGFDETKTGLPGMGIRIMRYRARVIGATLDLQSSSGKGTQVRCSFYPAPVRGMEKSIGMI